MIHIGIAAKHLREELGLTQRDAAEQLGISNVHLSNIENNKVLPSAAILETYKRLWGIDLYILGWCLSGDADRLPSAFREPVRKLTAAWQERIKAALRQMESNRASPKAG